ncbi:MAG TPA: NDP-sugar synthase, partial [Vicinamibacterales bacterium]|nr:NDP-sugar synthase [Vicinamibacterales bacterium]
GVPLVRRILRLLSAAGVTDAVLNLHHLPHTLTTVVGDGSDLGLRVRYSWESPVLGSAGGPAQAMPLLSGFGIGDRGFGRTVLIVNGDTLTDLDLRALVDDHRRSGALVTMAVIPNAEPEKYGGVAVAADGAVTGFVKRGSHEPSFHFVGVQAAEPGAFETVPRGTPCEVGTLYSSLFVSRPGAIRAFRTHAEFLDIGTPSDYLSASLRLSEREQPDATFRDRPGVSATARIERSVLWDDVVVEDGVMLRECVVTDGVRVPADTSWHGVTLRAATGELAPGERRIDGLAIGEL